MKSRVSIDVDHDNQPVIKIEYSPSDDVRDKLVKKFLESFGAVSSWTKMIYIFGDTSSINNTAIIRPIPQGELLLESEEMQQRHKYVPVITEGPVNQQTN